MHHLRRPALHAPDSDEWAGNRLMTSWTFESGVLEQVKGEDWKTLSIRIASMLMDNETDRKNKQLIHRKTNHSCRRAWLTVITRQIKYQKPTCLKKLYDIQMLFNRSLDNYYNIVYNRSPAAWTHPHAVCKPMTACVRLWLLNMWLSSLCRTLAC